MINSNFKLKLPENEPILDYAPGSPERTALKLELERQSAEVVEIPLIIGGQEVRTGITEDISAPHERGHVLAKFHLAGQRELEAAADAALSAKEEWESLPFEHRAAVFRKTADLLSGPYRPKVMAATMLGQSKTVHQAEIDCICELCDFLRFNPYFAEELFQDQPVSPPGVLNRMEYRPLDGFVAAVTPFNFTSIGGNLCSAPAMLGNTVVWKPASTAVLSNYYVMRVFMEAGLPAGVINFVPCKGKDMDRAVLSHRKLGGFHFTGSTEVFRSVWTQIGDNIEKYEAFPRLVGETGGKDFIFAHNSASAEPLVAALVLGAFEYQGQKCSAASRAFIPKSLWGRVKELLLEETGKLKTGNVKDFTNFCGAVIDKRAFDRIGAYIDYARNARDAKILIGGDRDDSAGYFVYPTVIEADSPTFKTMTEEIFGPVLTVCVYEDEKLDEALEACDSASPYALTGAVFTNDRYSAEYMEKKLRRSAGNFYINDKPTGAVVGQQPFGGGRSSGTNDKAGSRLNLIRWVSPRTIKETLVPSSRIGYPFMEEE